MILIKLIFYIAIPLASLWGIYKVVKKLWIKADIEDKKEEIDSELEVNNEVIKDMDFDKVKKMKEQNKIFKNL